LGTFQTARHLVRRFFGVLASRPLEPRAQDYVNSVLPPKQAALFWEQDPVDQRHAYDVAQRVRSRIDDDAAAIRAALLHDVGKRHSRLGPVSRSLATVLDGCGLPIPTDWRRYRDHGDLGAADLEAIGADELAVAFARGAKPGGNISADVWQVLREADDA
jgi:hypothetical protein